MMGDQFASTATKPSDRPSANGETSTARLVWRLLSLGLEHKARLAVALLVTVAMEVMVIAELFSSGLAIDVLRKQVNDDAPAPDWPLGLEPAAGTPFLTLLIYVSLAVLLFSVLRAVGYYLTRWTDELLAQAIVVDLRDRVYERLQTLSFGYYDTHDSGTIINRVTSDVQSVRAFVQGVLIRAITSGATLILYVATMFALNARLTLISLAFTVIQFIVMARYAKVVRPLFKIQREVLDDLIKKLSEAVQGMRVIRAFGREKQIVDQFDRRSEYARDQRYDIWRKMGNHLPWIMGTGWLSVAALLGYGGYLVLLGPVEGGIALGTVWIFFGLLRSLANQTESIIRVAGQMPEAITGAERVFEILDTEPAITSPPQPTPFERGAVKGHIEFRHVTFAYTTGETVLHDVNLTIKPGETIALVGPTGSGKTTLLQLVARFYDPTQGQVLIDGVDARERDLAELRRSIGFVFQDPFLFSNTIAMNVAFGRPDAPMEKVRASAELADASGFITKLADGYDTVIGERGVTLSGGERQRVSLARAVLVEPAILLLDDAMSAVDASTESRIQAALDSIGRTQTRLIIAHRLSTLRRADRVVVVEGGRIVAQGRHDELMEADGHYREAAMIQLAHEQEEGATNSDGGAGAGGDQVTRAEDDES